MMKLIFFSFLWIAGTLCDEAVSAPQSFESMLCKEWKLRVAEEGGRRIYPDDRDANDRFIFNANHTSEIIEGGESQDGLWQYDLSTKRLVITDRVSKETIIMTVVSITKDELVVKTIEDNEIMSTIYLSSVK